MNKKKYIVGVIIIIAVVLIIANLSGENNNSKNSLIEYKSVPRIELNNTLSYNYEDSLFYGLASGFIKFDNVEVKLGDSIHKKTDKYWNSFRPVPVSEIEENTYQLIDSIGEAINLEKTMKIFEALMNGKIPISIFNLDISKIMAYNEYEGYRLCADLMTNDKIAKWFSLGGYLAYGFKDKNTKYGARILLNLRKQNELTLKISTWYDVFETGKYN